jgi:hypothetical protein
MGKIPTPASQVWKAFYREGKITNGRFENYEILDWMVPRNAFFQKSAVGKFTFSLAGV